MWPRTRCPNSGRWYGFDKNELARKKAEMLSAGGNLSHFWAQYYNEANARDQMRADSSIFQYYEKKHLKMGNDGEWYLKGQRLKLGAGMDLAFNENEHTGDYTAIAVIGIAEDGYIYLLDLVQFKTSKSQVYYGEMEKLHDYWGFRTLYLDSSGSGKVVLRELQAMARRDGRALVVRGVHYTSHDGSKEERFAAVLEPRYEAGTIIHYKGGWVPTLEDQVIKPRPTNDDLEDAVFIAVDNTKSPARGINFMGALNTNKVVVAHNRFGGRRRA